MLVKCRKSAPELSPTSSARLAAVRAGDAELQLQLTLRARQREILRAAEILILGVCHQGVVLRFGDAELRPTEDLRAVRFRFDLRLDSIVRERL